MVASPDPCHIEFEPRGENGFSVAIRGTFILTKGSKAIKSENKIIKRLITEFRRLEDPEDSKSLRDVMIHSKRSTFAMKFCMKRMLRSCANIVVFRVMNNIPGIYNYSPIGKCLVLLPTLKRIDLFVKRYSQVIQVVFHMVFESQTRRTLVITDFTDSFEEDFNYEAYRFIVKKGIKSKKFILHEK